MGSSNVRVMAMPFPEKVSEAMSVMANEITVPGPALGTRCVGPREFTCLAMSFMMLMGAFFEMAQKRPDTASKLFANAADYLAAISEDMRDKIVKNVDWAAFVKAAIEDLNRGGEGDWILPADTREEIVQSLAQLPGFDKDRSTFNQQ